MGELKHTGLFVPSAGDIQSHTKEMGIWVPHRLPRRVFRQILSCWQRGQLPKDKPEYLDPLGVVDEGIKLLAEVEITWNWQRGDGSPLPQPAEDADVWDEISQDEANFVLTHIMDGTNPPPKNPAA